MIPSHALLMAAVDTLRLVEHRDGYQAYKQAATLLDGLFSKELPSLNDAAARLTRNEMKYCLRMMLRRDARIADISFPCLNS